MKKTQSIINCLFILLLITGCGRVSIDLGTGQVESAESEPVIEDVEETSTQPAESDKSGDLIPDGVLISTGNENSLTYIGETGQVLREIQTPGIITIDREDVVIAGAVDPDGGFPSVIYHTWQPDQALMINTNGQIETLRPSDGFLAITAAPGQTAVAFSEVLINEENFPHSFIFSGTPENLSNIPAFYDLVDDPYYWALKPVGVKTVAGQPQGIWYIKTGWGIGGADLIFAPNRGLYFYDLTNGDNIMYLDDNRNLQGISPDLTFAAHVQTPEMSGDRSLAVINLTTNEETLFALDPTSDRGAGFAVFSPDNHYSAWLEATGSMMSDPYDFHPRIRIGDIQTGDVIIAVEDTAVVQLINGDKVSMLQPAGWLDNESLLIEVRGEYWDDVTLLRLDITSGNLTTFASGAFLTFGYQ